MTRNSRSLHERLGQAIDDPHLMAGHLRKDLKSALGLAGDRAVTMGRGNPVGALFPMARPKPAPTVKPVAKKPAKKKRPVP